MTPSYPPRKTTRWYYLSLLWQTQHHIAMLPEKTVGRIMALLTPEEVLLFCTLYADSLRGLIARFLDDTAVLHMAEEHLPHELDAVGTLVGIEEEDAFKESPNWH